MATPRRIVRIYAELADHAGEVAGFLAASGGSSATVKLLADGDATTALKRWGEEMQELCGVLDGTHHDSYLMEAGQTFYWACCFAAVRKVAWEAIGFDDLARQAVASGIGSVVELRAACARLAGIAPSDAKPAKLFLLWRVADRLYRSLTPPDKQWSIEQLMEADLQEMKKRPYFEPILRMVPE
jgi:phosphoribosyl-ATP pyrophosphohydrolase